MSIGSRAAIITEIFKAVQIIVDTIDQGILNADELKDIASRLRPIIRMITKTNIDHYAKSSSNEIGGKKQR